MIKNPEYITWKPCPSLKVLNSTVPYFQFCLGICSLPTSVLFLLEVQYCICAFLCQGAPFTSLYYEGLSYLKAMLSNVGAWTFGDIKFQEKILYSGESKLLHYCEAINHPYYQLTFSTLPSPLNALKFYSYYSLLCIVLGKILRMLIIVSTTA